MLLEQLPRETRSAIKVPGGRTPRVLSIAEQLIKLLPSVATWSNCQDPKVEVIPSFPGPTADGTCDLILSDLDLINLKKM